jgi:hypothetical protein
MNGYSLDMRPFSLVRCSASPVAKPDRRKRRKHSPLGCEAPKLAPKFFAAISERGETHLALGSSVPRKSPLKHLLRDACGLSLPSFVAVCPITGLQFSDEVWSSIASPHLRR